MVSIEECSGRCEDGVSVDKEGERAEIIALVEIHSLVMGEGGTTSKEQPFIKFGEWNTKSWKPRVNQERAGAQQHQSPKRSEG